MKTIITALLTVIAATLVIIAVRLEYDAHHSQVAQIDTANCMQHLSEMDAASKAECVHIWGHDPTNPFNLHAGAEQEAETIQREQAENPEDRRLDARGLK